MLENDYASALLDVGAECLCSPSPQPIIGPDRSISWNRWLSARSKTSSACGIPTKPSCWSDFPPSSAAPRASVASALLFACLSSISRRYRFRFIIFRIRRIVSKIASTMRPSIPPAATDPTAQPQGGMTTPSTLVPFDPAAAGDGGGGGWCSGGGNEGGVDGG